MNIDLESIKWQTTWDLKERNLPLNDGFPSTVAAVSQKSFLSIFGSVGSFPSERGGRVGFAQWTFDLETTPTVKGIEITASSPADEVSYLFILKMRGIDKGSFQAPVKLSQNKKTITLRKNDFKFVVRGRELHPAPSIDLAQVHSAGFLVTRSQQNHLSGRERVFFQIDLHALSLLD